MVTFPQIYVGIMYVCRQWYQFDLSPGTKITGCNSRNMLRWYVKAGSEKIPHSVHTERHQLNETYTPITSVNKMSTFSVHWPKTPISYFHDIIFSFLSVIVRLYWNPILNISDKIEKDTWCPLVNVMTLTVVVSKKNT